MPTLLRVEGFRFSFFAGDGVEPQHAAFFLERWNEYFGR